jgi:hypothetical protein
MARRRRRPRPGDDDRKRHTHGSYAWLVWKKDWLGSFAGSAVPKAAPMSVPADYTGLMRWLASLEAEFIQGHVFFMNGGANLSA